MLRLRRTAKLLSSRSPTLLRGWPALVAKREVLAQAFRLPNGVSDRQTLTSRRRKLTAAAVSAIAL
jgi:hypothetical protein